MGERRSKVQRMADQYELTREHVGLCRRRVAFLLERVNGRDERPLIDLLANAYAQGLDDAVTIMERRGALQEREGDG